MAAIYRRQAVEAAALSLLIGAGIERQADLRLTIQLLQGRVVALFGGIQTPVSLAIVP